jgi:hypothetical protein
MEESFLAVHQCISPNFAKPYKEKENFNSMICSPRHNRSTAQGVAIYLISYFCGSFGLILLLQHEDLRNLSILARHRVGASQPSLN